MHTQFCRNTAGRAGVVRLCAFFGLALAATPAMAAAPEAAEKPLTREEQLYEWRFACDTGEGAACIELARTYEPRTDVWGRPVPGDGVKRDGAKSSHYYRRACSLGVSGACRNGGASGAAQD